jgi:hypothetical protein
MLEFALVLPILLLVLFGIIDAGRFFYDVSRVTNVARDSARWYAVQRPLIRDSCVSRSQELLGGGAQAQAATVDCILVGDVPNQRVRVSISGVPFRVLTPFVPLQATLPPATAEFRWEFQ